MAMKKGAAKATGKKESAAKKPARKAPASAKPAGANKAGKRSPPRAVDARATSEPPRFAAPPSPPAAPKASAPIPSSPPRSPAGAQRMAPSSGRSVAASRAEPSGALPATPDEGALPETTSGGGPVVLLPAEVAAAWRGTLAPPGATVPPGWTWGKRGGPKTDYDRALEPNDAKQTARGGYGWLPVGSGRALIFSDELTTVWLPTGDGGVVVRGPDVSGATPAKVRDSVPKDGWTTYLEGVRLEDGRVFLFDSAAAGADEPMDITANDGVAVGKPGPGTYAVSCAHVGNTDFFRFTRGKALTATRPPAAPPPAAKTSGPEWKTRPIPFAQLPRGPNLEARYKISFPSVAADGTIVGLERGKPAEARAVRIARDGTSTPISVPGQLAYAAVSGHEPLVLGATPDGKLLEFPLSADASQATVRFDAGGRVWSLHSLSPTRLVIAQGSKVRLLDTATAPWKSLDDVSVAPVSIPEVDVLAGGKWVLVGRSPRIRLFAVIRDRLRLIQSWNQVEGGMLVADGRPFLSTAGAHDYQEVLNLDEVHASFS